jgi:hypothetical protein
MPSRHDLKANTQAAQAKMTDLKPPAKDTTAQMIQRAVATPQTLTPAIIQALQQNYGRGFVQLLRTRSDHVVEKKAVPATQSLDDYLSDIQMARSQPAAPATSTHDPRQINAPKTAHSVPLVMAQRNTDQDKVQRQADDLMGGQDVQPDVETRIQSARGSGASLPGESRKKLETAFGADFSGVHVHTDSESDGLNRAVQARAFTTGRDIFFRSGEYNPGSSEGQTLLAHELTHVVQQSPNSLQRQISRVSRLSTSIQRLEIIKAGKHRLLKASDDKKQAIDTTKLNAEQRNALILELTREQNLELLAQIQEEWGGKASSLADLSEYLALGEQIAALQKKKDSKALDEGGRKQIGEISKKLTAAKALVDPKSKDPAVQMYRDVIFPLIQSLNSLMGDQEVDLGAPANLNLNVGAAERLAYRQDVAQMGTWGGLAEAEALAQHLQLRTPIFVIVNGRFRQSTEVGRNHQRQDGWALVHLGNHYEVVRNVQDGTQVGQQAAWLETAKEGDCLFESMFLISRNGVRAQDTLAQVTQLRTQISNSLTDPAIDASIHEMLVYGDVAGAGPKTRKLVSGRYRRAGLESQIDKADEAAIAKKEAELKNIPDLAGYGLDALKAKYLEERQKSPKSDATVSAFTKFAQALNSAYETLNSLKALSDYNAPSYDEPKRADKIANWTEKFVFLYRKMSSVEFGKLKNKKFKSVTSDNNSRKWFSTTAEHSFQFTNENVVMSGAKVEEVIVQIKLDRAKFQKILQKHFPAYQKESYKPKNKDKVLIHQELLAQGNIANTQSEEQIQQIFDANENFNIGFSFDNIDTLDAAILEISSSPVK